MQVREAPSITYRTHRPGDLGYIVHRCAAIYARDYGWTDPKVESVISRIASDFLALHDPASERCWVAERQDDGRFAGCIMLAKDPELRACAKLRVFFVEPDARGLGVGRELVRLCVEFAEGAGCYERIRLLTESGLGTARYLYRRAGFEMVETVEEGAFGQDSVAEIWELRLRSE